MKILKYIFLLILLAVLSLTVYIWSKDGHYQVENQIQIPLSNNKVYKFLIDFRNWEAFNHDENLKTYPFEIEDDATNFGISTFTIRTIENVNLFKSDSIQQRIHWFNHETKSTWKLALSENKTTVLWKCSGSLGFFEKTKALFGNSLEHKIEGIQIKNLQKLKETLVKEYAHFEIKEIEFKFFKELFFLDKTTDVKLNGYLQDPHKNSERFKEFIKNNALELNSPVGLKVPFSTINFLQSNISISGWLKEEIYTTPESEIICNSKSDLYYIKLNLIGDYSHLKKGIDTGIDYAKQNEFLINELSDIIIHFKTLYPFESKPSLWITEIYIPIITVNQNEL